MNEFIPQFLLEARELTEQATQDLLALEQAPADRHHLESAFRAFHTLKGAAAIMEYAPMERLLHRAEDRLQELRRDNTSVSAAIIDGCLACIGQVIRWLDAIGRDGDLPRDADQAAVRVERLLEKGSEARHVVSLGWAEDLRQGADSVVAEAARFAVRYAPRKDVFFKGVDPMGLAGRLPGIVALRFVPQRPWPTLEEMQPFDSNLTFEVLSTASREDIETALGSALQDAQIVDIADRATAAPAVSDELALRLVEAQIAFVRTARPLEAFAGSVGSARRVVSNILNSLGRPDLVTTVEAAATRAVTGMDADIFLLALADIVASIKEPGEDKPRIDLPEPAQGAAAGAIRVDVTKVDAIVDLTGELLVVKNALAHVTRMAGEGADPVALGAALRVHTTRLERHVKDLQRAVLDLRVLPVSRVFSRFPLLIRETAAKLGKQVAFRSEGDDTLADKAVVEALFEPLLHVVRNAIDHGIETPAVRIASGKAATADIVMRAWREGEHVLVDVSDNGRGVDTAIVRQLAASRGVVTAEAAAALDEAEAVDLIFAPGFTTASEVTDLSGRGVGMNAVRAAVSRMGGSVVLTNQAGQGLTVRFTLPFTVMMTRVMTVEVAGQVFGLPFDAVLETIRIPRVQIRPLGAGQAIVLRDAMIPIVNLADHLELDVDQQGAPDIACLVITYVRGERVGIEVDRPGERLDLMLKPVEGLLSGMKAISGTSLLGDGRVLIVLDLGALFG